MALCRGQYEPAAGRASPVRGLRLARVEERIKGGTFTNVSRNNGPILEVSIGPSWRVRCELGGAAVEWADATAGVGLVARVLGGRAVGCDRSARVVARVG